MESLGYIHRSNCWDSLVGTADNSHDLEKRYFSKPRVHVHVRELGRVNQEYALLFRDYLRANPIVKEAYQSIKIELANRFPNDKTAYYAIKDPYMDTVYQAALLWNKEKENGGHREHKDCTEITER